MNEHADPDSGGQLLGIRIRRPALSVHPLICNEDKKTGKPYKRKK